MVANETVGILDDLKSIGENLFNQGKSKEEVVQAFGVYLSEVKKNINPDDLD